MHMTFQLPTHDGTRSQLSAVRAGTKPVLLIISGIAAVSALCCATQIAVPMTFVYLVEKFSAFLC